MQPEEQPEIDPEIDAVLAERLAGVAGGLGGAGAAWSAKRLRTETAADSGSFDPAQGPAVLGTLSRELDVPLDEAQEGPDGAVTLRGVVGSGFGGMNPAWVVAVVDAVAGRVSIAAYGKEGLIKQRTAEKAVRRLLAELPGS